jgi:hypothetical protein
MMAMPSHRQASDLSCIVEYITRGFPFRLMFKEDVLEPPGFKTCRRHEKVPHALLNLTAASPRDKGREAEPCSALSPDSKYLATL